MLFGWFAPALRSRRKSSAFLFTVALSFRKLTFFPLLLLVPGISVKMQELRLVVFLTRYLDLFTTFYSLYNSVLKITYIAVTAGIIYTIHGTEPIKSLYNYNQDSFEHWKYCAAPAFGLAILVHLFGSGLHGFNTMELLWTFSIILESVAILPQLHLLRKYRLVENLTGKFVIFLGLYRFFYILNWIYRANTQRWYRQHWLTYIAGVVQTLMYIDFFYQYVKVLRQGENSDDESGLVFELSGRSEEIETAIEPLMETSEEPCRSRRTRTTVENTTATTEAEIDLI